MDSKDLKKIVLEKLVQTLKPRGFKRTGNNFIYSNGELTYYINVQSSQSSTASTLKLTLNIEIASKTIYKLQDTSLSEKDTRHFIKRIGNYLQPSSDKWWIMTNTTTANEVAEEINSIVVNHVLPQLFKFNSTNDFATFWTSGEYGGLTEFQRKEYLSLLSKTSSINI